jgi:hypothetical protein
VVVHADRVDDLPRLLREGGVATAVPVVVLVGGAAGLSEDERTRCDLLIRQCLVPELERVGACLVDGATDAGVIALAGRARHDAGARQPHLGVVAAGTAQLPDRAGNHADGDGGDRNGLVGLEPHHSLVVVVPGDEWGDEVPWLAAVATAVAGGAPSITMLANGGDLAYDDVRHSLAANRPVLALTGTGRTADEIAAAQSGAPADGRARELAASSLVRSVAFDPDVVRSALAAALTPTPTAQPR